jgi:hypothetical protein
MFTVKTITRFGLEYFAVCYRGRVIRTFMSEQAAIYCAIELTRAVGEKQAA